MKSKGQTINIRSDTNRIWTFTKDGIPWGRSFSPANAIFVGAAVGDELCGKIPNPRIRMDAARIVFFPHDSKKTDSACHADRSNFNDYAAIFRKGNRSPK
jgi:hypothetical protein